MSVKLLLELNVLNTRSALSLRQSFIMSTSFMFINDLVYFSIWYFVYRAVPSIGGWKMEDMALLLGLSALCYGLNVIFSEGGRFLSFQILRGGLDSYLTLPRSPLLLAVGSKTNVTGWGDVGAGIFTLWFSGQVTLTNFPLIVLFALSGATIFSASSILFQSMAFWVRGSETTTTMFQDLMIMVSSYPGSVYQGYTRVVVLTLLPAGFITFLPVQAIKSGRLMDAALIFLFSAGYLLLAAAVFRIGLKRYTSGSTFVYLQ